MTQQQGWIKLHRTMMNWEWYTDLPVKVLFLHLLLSANHQPARWQGMTVDRGELITSLEHLAQATGLSVRNVRTALNKLKKTGEITVKVTHRFSLIKIENYSLYQSYDDYERHADDTVPTHCRHGGDTLSTTNNNKKNNKNKKNDKNRLRRKPSYDIEEIKRRAELNDDFDF